MSLKKKIKQKIRNYNSLDEVFGLLNESTCEYIVLRNYEELHDSGAIIQDGIDFLCSNRKQFVQILGAKKRKNSLNAAHYEIFVNEKRVEIDVREVGDGYYCQQWESACLKHKEFYDGKFYVIDRENYYFSLIYHCLIHKGQFSDKSFEKINLLSDTKKTQEELRNMLFDFMKDKDYRITNSSDWKINIHSENSPDELLDIKDKWVLKRKLFCLLKKLFDLSIPVLVFITLLLGTPDVLGAVFLHENSGSWGKRDLFLGKPQKAIGQYLKGSVKSKIFAQRCRNQFEFYTMRSSSETWLLGKNNTFYQRWQTQFVTDGKSNPEYKQYDFDAYVQKLSEFQTLMNKNGKSFLYLLTAAKAEIYPELLPWQEQLIYKRYGSVEEDLKVLLKKSLEKYSIHYYDVTDDLISLKEVLKNSVFYPTGVHWSLRTTAREANTIIKQLNRTDIKEPIQIKSEKSETYETDKEILYWIQLIKDPCIDYRTPERIFKDKSNLSVYMYGTSFLPHLAKIFFNSENDRLFNKVVVQEYFRTISTYDDNGYDFHFLPPATSPDEINLYENICKSDIIIMDQQGCTGLYNIEEPHTRFLDYLIGRFSVLEVE